MSREHMLRMPRAVWILHILQLITAVLVVGLSAFLVYFVPYNAIVFAIFTARPIRSVLHLHRLIGTSLGSLHCHRSHLLLRRRPRRPETLQLDRPPSPRGLKPNLLAELLRCPRLSLRRASDHRQLHLLRQRLLPQARSLRARRGLGRDPDYVHGAQRHQLVSITHLRDWIWNSRQ